MMQNAQLQRTENNILAFSPKKDWTQEIDHILWSALNLLEADLCRLESCGTLHWLANNNGIFALNGLPKNIDELGHNFNILSLSEILRFTPIKDDVRVILIEDFGVEIRHNLETKILTLRKISNGQIKDFSNDIEVQNLKSALDEKRICLYYQPIVCAKTFTPIRYECLARLQKLDGNIALPYEFIPAAERSGLIKQLDIMALEIAIARLNSGFEFGLSSNLSFATICDTQAMGEIYNIITRANLQKSALTIEITETIAIHDFDIAARFGEFLQKHGVRLSIDDFGAGHTSFKAIKDLPVSEIKIDGQYVQNLHLRNDAFHFISAISALSHEYGRDIIAERVEIIEEIEALKPLKLDGLQGYYFGKPAALK